MKKIITLLVLLTSFNLMAKDGSSGCGPGWYILKENSLLSSSLRATTNGILAPTTTIGMTLGTSNCTKHKIVQKEKEAIHYVTNNLYELKSEIAKGSGDYLSGLHDVIGCKASSEKSFSRKAQSNYGQVFKSEEPKKVLLKVYEMILRDRELVMSCSLG